MKIVHTERLKSGKAAQKKKSGKAWDSMMFLLLQKTAAESGAKDKKKLEAIQSSMKRAAGTEDEETVRRRMVAFYEEHLKKVKSQQKACDFRINDETLGVLHIFFMVLGLCSFVAMGCCVLGFMSYSASPRFIPYDVVSDDIHWQLSDYPSWDTFVDNCCCMSSGNQTRFNEGETYRMAERWICANGFVKERVREMRASDGAILSTLHLRPLCGTTFGLARSDRTTNCSVQVLGSAVLLPPQCSQDLDVRERKLW